MRIIHAFWLVCGVAIAGCGNETPPSAAADPVTSAVASDSQPTATACRKEDYIDDGYDFGARMGTLHKLSQNSITPFRCVRLLGASDVSQSENKLQLINIGTQSTSAGVASGELRIQLHEIKTKAFLRNRPIAILNNGKQFAALEKECADIKAAGVLDVVAVLPMQFEPATDHGVGFSEVSRISPREFITERSFGVWCIVNLTRTELDSPLFLGMASAAGDEPVSKGQASAGVGLVRTLVVAEGSDLPGEAPYLNIPANRGLTFVLDGGLSNLRRFQVEATAMARALAGPRINERGCAG